MVEYLSYFIDLINKLNFKIKVLCLDREFYSIDVFEFLQNNGVPHIVPVVKKGEQMKQILIGNKARSTQYVMKNSRKKILLDIIIDVKDLKGKREKKRCENLGFVVFGVSWSPRKVSTVYRRRFAIESSYRMRNLVKPKTSSKNATIQVVSKLYPIIHLSQKPVIFIFFTKLNSIVPPCLESTIKSSSFYFH